jgi:hypothetical protein
LSKPTEAAVDYRRVVELANTSVERQLRRVELVGLLLQAGNHDSALAELEQALQDHKLAPSTNVLHIYLRHCTVLAGKRLWGLHPYRERLLIAAKTLLELCRRDYAAPTWTAWVKQARQAKDLQPLLTHAELAVLLQK